MDPSQQQAVPYYQPIVYVPHAFNGEQHQQQIPLPPHQYAIPQPSQEMYPQIPVQQPQYVFQQPPQQPETPTQQFMEAPRRACKPLNAYKVGSAISVLSFVSYFIVTPGAFPWFLVILAISFGAMASKYIREHYDSSSARYLKHTAWFSVISAAFLLTNLWSGGFPWAVVPISIWGAVLGFHTLSMYNTEPLYKKLFRHIIIYVAVGLIIIVCCGYIPHFGPGNNFNRFRAGKGQDGPKDPKGHEPRRGLHHERRFVMWSRPAGDERHRPTTEAATTTGVPQTTTKRPEHAKGEEPKGHEAKGHHAKGNKGDKDQRESKRPQTTSAPTDEEDIYRQEYAREHARNDIHLKTMLRLIGYSIMAVWTIILLIHALKTKRAIKARNAQMAQAQQAELQSVSIQQPVATGIIQ